MPKLTLLTAHPSGSSCEYEMIIDGKPYITSTQSLNELNTYIQKNYPLKNTLAAFPSYWSDLFWFTASTDDEKIPQLVSFIQSLLDHPLLIEDENIRKLLGYSPQSTPNQNETFTNQLEISTISSLDVETRSAIFEFCLPFSVFWHTSQEVRLMLLDTPPSLLLIQQISNKLDLPPEDRKHHLTTFSNILAASKRSPDTLVSPWEWWLLSIPEPYQQVNEPAPNWKVSNQSEPVKEKQSPRTNLYDNIMTFPRLQSIKGEYCLSNSDADAFEPPKWDTLYNIGLQEFPFAPSLSCIQKLRKLDQDTRTGIIWDLFVISLSTTGGLDSRIQLSLVVMALFLSVEPSIVSEFESKFARIAQKTLISARSSGDSNESSGQNISRKDLLENISSPSEQEFPETSNRWWKIGLGAAVGGGLLIATGGLAAPVLLPAVGGLASAAAATAGAVGLGTLSATISVGSASLMAGGVPLVAGLFGAAGASLFSYQVHVLTKDVKEFIFIQIPKELSEELLEEQNLLNKIDKNIDTALLNLTKVISRPEILVNIYAEKLKPSINLEQENTNDSESVDEDKIDELMTEFEIMEADDDTEEQIQLANLQESDNILCCSSQSFEEEKRLAEQIVIELEQSISNITVQLQEKEKERTIPTKEEKQTHVLDKSKVISVVKSTECPPEMKVCICVCGWIWSAQDFQSTWQGVYNLLPSSEVYSLRWESSELQALGRHLVSGAAASIAMQVAQKYAMRTVLAATLSALALPASALQLSALIGHPWNVVFNRAKKCGKLLAWSLMNRIHGTRPITLTGFSHGGRLIFHCLEELARCNAKGIIENAFILGAPVCTDPKRWAAIRNIVSGRLVNGYSTTDWILLLHKNARMEPTLAGLDPVPCVGVENVDISYFVPGHLLYRQDISKALAHCNFGSSIPSKHYLWSAQKISRSV